MVKDIWFVLMVLSVSIYAHSNKSKIVGFIENEQAQVKEKSFVLGASHYP